MNLDNFEEEAEEKKHSNRYATEVVDKESLGNVPLKKQMTQISTSSGSEPLERLNGGEAYERSSSQMVIKGIQNKSKSAPEYDNIHTGF